MKRIAPLLLLVACVAGSSVASAQDNVTAARDAEAAARQAFRAGEHVEAATGFAAAFKLDPKANTKYNEALAWAKAGEEAAAADAYAAALAFGGLDAALAEKATTALAALNDKLGTVMIKEPVGARVSVGHAEDRGVPASIHLPPGQHAIEVRFASGDRDEKTVTVVAGSETVVVFDAVVPEPPSPTPTPPPVVTTPDGVGGMAIAGWTMVGVGALSLAAMGVTGGLTLSKVSQYDDTGNTDVALHDEAVTLKTTTNVLFGVGAGLVSIGAILLIVDAVGDDDAEDAVAFTGDGVRLRF